MKIYVLFLRNIEFLLFDAIIFYICLWELNTVSRLGSHCSDLVLKISVDFVQRFGTYDKMKCSSNRRIRGVAFKKFSVGLYHWNRWTVSSEIFRANSEHEYLVRKWRSSPQNQQTKILVPKMKIQCEQRSFFLKNRSFALGSQNFVY